MNLDFFNFFESYAMYEVQHALSDLEKGTLLTFVKLDKYWNRDLGYDAYEVQFVEQDVMIYEVTSDGTQLQEEVANPKHFFCKMGMAEPTLADARFQQRKAQDAAQAAEQERQRILEDAQRRLARHRQK